MPVALDSDSSDIILQHVSILPQELVDSVLDYLDDDKTTLSACSLVSSSWLESCRRSLFRSLSVEGGDREKGLSAFWDLLQASSSIRKCLKNLRIVCFRQRWYTMPNERPQIFSGQLSYILDKLPSLQSLHLAGLLLGSLPSQSSIKSMCGGHRLKRLTVRDIMIIPNYKDPTETRGQPVLDLLSLFVEVQELEINNVSFITLLPRGSPVESHASSLLGPSHFLRAHTLSFTFSPDNRLLTCVVRRALHMDSLVSLASTCTPRSDVGMFNEFVGAIPRLQTLDLNLRHGFDQFGEAAPSLPLPNISLCTCLRSLTLHVGFPDQNHAHGQHVWRTLLDVLHLSPPTITHLTIKIFTPWHSSEYTIYAADWCRVNEHLNRFTSLQIVRFLWPEVAGNRDETSSLELAKARTWFVKGMLPVLHAKGILLFD